jgi:hypothetical protein
MRYDRAPLPGVLMFSTLLGVLPRDPDAPARDGPDADLAALAETGLELISEGGPPAGLDEAPGLVVARWRAAADSSPVPVKAVIAGPYSAGRAVGRAVEDAAEVLREVVLALAEAECPLVEVVEDAALPVADDPVEAMAFRAAHLRLIEGSEGVHASLALTGGNLDTAPDQTFFDLAYSSFAFDLINGPDNWRLIARAPGDRGIVCGAMGMAPGADRTRELLVWAAHYAASTGGRSLARIGLANAPADPRTTRADALERLATVAEASRLAAVEDPTQLARMLDPRAVDPRSAALGRFAPATRRRRP